MILLILRLLAAWRITELVVEDEVSREIREWVDEHAPDKLKYLVNCKRCVSVWAGLAVVFVLPPRLVYALAASAGTLLVNERLEAAKAAAGDRAAAQLRERLTNRG